MIRLVAVAVMLAALGSRAESPHWQVWEKEVAAFEAADRTNPPPAGAVLFVGSSNIRLWQSIADDFPGATIIRRGVGGCWLADLPHLADRLITPYRPRTIIVSAGNNDLHAQRTPESVLAAFTQLVAAVRTTCPNARIAFLSINPSPARWSERDAEQRANALVRAYASAGENLDFIDIWDAMLGQDGQPRPDYFLADHLHPSPAGNQARAAIIRRHLSPPRHPNILHIHADDHRADGLHALGNAVLQTPNLDRLVESGTTFTRCYTMGSMVGAVCLPSRTMLLTGRSLFRIPPAGAKPYPTLADVIRHAGYQTWHCGKGGNEYTAGLRDFETNLVMDDHGAEPRRGSSRRHADAALAFLGSRDTRRPFYMYIAPPVPHDPRAAEPEFHRMYDPAKIPLPAAFMPLHPWDNGDMTVRDEKLAPWPRTPEDTRQQLADYYSCISGLDHHVGRIFDALKASGEWTNTIVIFSGDNGLSLGEHGLFGKQNLYEFGGMHVPLVIAGPGMPTSRCESLVYLMDLFPTLCEIAGAEIPREVEGRSLYPVLNGTRYVARDALYTAYQLGQRAVRTDRWKLIRYPLVDRTQLFDLSADPHELRNLADDPTHAGTLREMTALLEREMKTFGDPAPLVVAKPRPAEWTPPTPSPVKRAGQRAASRDRVK